MTRRTAGIVGTYLVLLAGAVLALGPYVLSLLTSLKEPAQLARRATLTWPRRGRGRTTPTSSAVSTRWCRRSS